MFKITPISFFKKIPSAKAILPSANMQVLRISSGQKTISEKKLEIPEEILFFDFLKYRREQAFRSVIIKLEENKDVKLLKSLCSLYSKHFNIFQYNISKNQFVLVEFQKQDELKNFLNDSLNENCNNSFGIEGREFMLFKKKKLHLNLLTDNCNVKLLCSSIINESVSLTLKNLNGKEIDIQLSELFENFKLNDLGVRLRFLTFRQMESIIKGLMPEAVLYPFGSSVSGFGLNGCDLDLVVLKESSKNKSIICEKSNTKSEVDRHILQDHLSLLSEILKMFGKGCSNVNFIKYARVPIVKYKNDYTHVECDLSMFTDSALQMTQILYILSNFDERVKPLVNFIRIWAKSLDLVAPKQQPNHNFTNFCLTLLVIFFLQQSSPNHSAILPPFNYFPFENGSHYLKNEDIALGIQEFRSKTEVNNKSVGSLLHLYFKFYSKFDFENYGCCPKTGEIIKKTTKFTYTAVYIKNPIELDLNVSQNVSKKCLKKFQKCADVAFQILKENYDSEEKKNNLLSLLCNNKLYSGNNLQEMDSEGSLNVKNIFC